ncbi:MAG: metal ABC transporter permease, partial [Clostridia bacterium]|nr:metal ABC transporter permease [Clostridia bacterium]
IFKSFLSVTIGATVISVTTALVGLLLAIGLPQGVPVGPTIVIVQAAAFGICYLIGFIKDRVRV